MVIWVHPVIVAAYSTGRHGRPALRIAMSIQAIKLCLIKLAVASRVLRHAPDGRPILIDQGHVRDQLVQRLPPLARQA
jgi:hypothetical protein